MLFLTAVCCWPMKPVDLARKLPTYDFGAAKVIVSLGADFLGTWLNPVEYAKGYATGRKIDEKKPSMSKHYQFESYPEPDRCQCR